jgi:phytoene synthase
MTAVATGGLAAAYDACAVVTREQARNFHYGIRLLSPDKRSALCAVYALARRIDDIGDGDLPRETKLVQLAAVRAALASGAADDPVLLAVHDAASRYPIPLEAFDELLDGVEMDVVGTRFATFDDLVHYCRCVAGSIGRLCLGIFGASDQRRASGLADTLGIALQQTNILRDVREDLRNGRVYLPQEDLERFDVTLELDADGSLVDDGSLSQLIRMSAARATAWYDAGWQLLPLLDRRSAACCRAMAGIYRRLLDDISAHPELVRDRRLSLSGWAKAAVAVRALAGSS